MYKNSPKGSFERAEYDVMEAFMNAKCVGAGTVGSNGSSDCTEIAAYGSIGECVCNNHFAAKFKTK